MDSELYGQIGEEDQRFRRLQEEHTRYSQQLENLKHKTYLSEDEKLEEVRLKKLKLRLKDQMSLLGRDPKRALSVS